MADITIRLDSDGVNHIYLEWIGGPDGSNYASYIDIVAKLHGSDGRPDIKINGIEVPGLL